MPWILLPARTDRLGECFTDLELGLVPEAWHFVHWEAPDLVAQAVRTFFAGR